MSEPQDAPERIDPITFFSPEIHNEVTGMIHLGKHSKEINFAGHRFGMETIRPFMKFAIGQAMEPYRDTLVQPQAWAAMHVGMALTSIDGKPMSQLCPPMGNDPVEFVKGRFQYITDETGWWQPTIDYLMAEYLAMEGVVIQAIGELHSLVLAGKAISSPWPGFSTATAPSEEEMTVDGPSSDSSS